MHWHVLPSETGLHTRVYKPAPRAGSMRRRGQLPWLTLLACAALLCALVRAQTGDNSTSARPPACGDYAVQSSGEACDDGNTADGDGCSSTCSIEAGFMCEYAYRAGDAGAAPGVLYTWYVNQTLALTTTPETCTGAELCVQGSLWRPENWAALYPAGTVLPPGGYYCGQMCQMFPAPDGYRVEATCQLVGVNECQEGLSACAFNAYCEDKLPSETATGLGYVCRCDEQYFTTDSDGLGCALSGVEVTAVVAGKAGYDPAEDPPPDVAVLEALRGAFIDLIMAQNYTTGVTRAALLEGVEGYPPELVSASGVGVSLKRPTVSLYLAVSRAIGDLTLKTPSPIVSARPEVRIERLRGDDLFVVVACDGIWDVLSDQAAVDIAAEHVHSPQEAAQAIVRAALAKGSGDNLTVTVVVFGWQTERAAALLEGKATTKPKAAPRLRRSTCSVESTRYLPPTDASMINKNKGGFVDPTERKGRGSNARADASPCARLRSPAVAVQSIWARNSRR